jgi:Ca-activated chloride channel family protein
MAGEPIATLRRATAEALGALAESDIVSVVLFGSEVETLIEAQRRDQLKELDARIAQIETAGGAALYDGLNQAAAQLRRHATPATRNQLILVTDGPPTKGPRETEDFAKLADVFAREGIIVSTIGLGADFSEDMLAAMARSAHGRFRYAAEPGELRAALLAEVAPRPALAGTDAVLTIEFKRLARKLRFYTWRQPAIEATTLTWRFPHLFGDQPLTLLASAELDSYYARMELADFATVRLRWKGADGEPRESVKTMGVRFSRDGLDLRGALDAGVALTGASAIVREGLERAIEQLDRKDMNRAFRELRVARNNVRDLNFDLEDARIAEIIRQLDTYLATAERGTVAMLNRKDLRSGLRGLFDPPAVIVDPKN